MRYSLTTIAFTVLIFLLTSSVSSGQTVVAPSETASVPTQNMDPDVSTLLNELDKLNISTDQYHVLLMARDTGRKFGFGKVLMGIVWQETRAGVFGPVGDISRGFGERSYGIAQVQRKTARKMLKLYPSLGVIDTDEELIARLIMDKQFNLNVAVHILVYLRNKGLTADQIIQTYNRGYQVKHPESQPYTKSVNKALKNGVVSKVDTLAQNSGSGG